MGICSNNDRDGIDSLTWQILACRGNDLQLEVKVRQRMFLIQASSAAQSVASSPLGKWPCHLHLLLPLYPDTDLTFFILEAFVLPIHVYLGLWR